jgi:hypothetical protein
MSVETTIALGVKLLALLGMGLYVVFALIMVRQEQLMAHVLEEAFEPVLRGLVLVHVLAAIGAFVLAIILL